MMIPFTIEGGCTRPMKREELLFCIKYYAEISDCAKAMNNDLRYTFTPYRIILPIITALHLYKLIEQKDSAALVPLVPWFLNILFLCTLGERLEYERISLCKILYDVPWYHMDIDQRKTYHIYLGHMLVPMKMMVKPNAELDFSFLTEILKGTYTFLVYFSSGK
ncbi:uncharacterized protein LOC123311133 [Coccinella septempunctata]|uniref:uncharacterized protein LOC123311133 n=1 Tax=Coccinella septempunctata TaxID=41139 RepID=UPI001D07BF76|nr:uncharacterized protein LOC123311133 [Coccinella septempunctata]